MKRGIELIAKERKEQIEKHGWNNDDGLINGELVQAAKHCLDRDTHEWPWSGMMGNHFKDKIRNKSYKDRVIVAGAFLAAELDRLNKCDNYPITDLSHIKTVKEYIAVRDRVPMEVKQHIISSHITDVLLHFGNYIIDPSISELVEIISDACYLPGHTEEYSYWEDFQKIIYGDE